MSGKPLVVPQIRVEKLTKVENLDKLHAATLNRIEKLPVAMTRTYSNPAPVSKPKSVPASTYRKLDKLLGPKRY